MASPLVADPEELDHRTRQEEPGDRDIVRQDGGVDMAYEAEAFAEGCGCPMEEDIQACKEVHMVEHGT